MRIKEIYIEKLFGMFTYNIPFHLEERITIIHSPNGYGKTTILKMIDALFNEKEYIFFKIPFKIFLVKFDDEKSIKIERTEGIKEVNGEKLSQIILTFSMPNSKNKPFTIELIPVIKDVIKKQRLLRNFDYHLLDPSKDLWVYEPYDEILTSDEIFQRNGFKIFSGSFKEKRESWFEGLIQEFNVVFIETQRLIITEETGKRFRKRYWLKSAVVTYSEDLKDLIQKKLTEYAELSQSLDRSFPARLVKFKEPNPLNEEEIREKLTYLEEKRRGLMEVGLLDKDSSITPDIKTDEIDESTINVLNVYFVDTEEKLAIFDELYEKINLFSNIINNRFLHKSLSISKQEGYIVSTEDGRKLNLEDLSSGEKHEIILIYEMLFNAKPNFLILIDEPEISFHVEWQEVFLDNLLEIAKLSNLEILIATHSPQIINDNWHLTVGLE